MPASGALLLTERSADRDQSLAEHPQPRPAPLILGLQTTRARELPRSGLPATHGRGHAVASHAARSKIPVRSLTRDEGSWHLACRRLQPYARAVGQPQPAAGLMLQCDLQPVATPDPPGLVVPRTGRRGDYVASDSAVWLTESNSRRNSQNIGCPCRMQCSKVEQVSPRRASLARSKSP